jgi:hypothetical protein
MMSFFSNAEASILVRLLIAHCLTDFFFQPNKWVSGKRGKIWRSKYLWYHGFLTGLVTWIFLGNLQLWWAVFIIMITHTIIDAIKLRLEKKYGSGLKLFLADQFMHSIIIIATWLWIVGGWEKLGGLLREYLPQYHILLRVLGYLIMIGPVGYIIQFITRKWLHEINPEDSLQNAGKWIGVLERVLTLTFVFINQFGAIGFLITAKSLLRVIDKPDKPNGEPTLIKPFSSRKRTEYVLIGTFLSFSIAILTGLIINWLLSF